MLGYVAIVHTYLKKNIVSSFKVRRGPQRQNCSRQNSVQANTARSRTPRSVSLRGVRLRAVTFGSSENVIDDSAQC